MRWLGRILAMVLSLLVVTCPLYVASILEVGFGGLGYFLMFALAVASGLVAIVLVAIPGVAYLHRRRVVGIRPRLALVAAVGTAMGLLGCVGLALLGGASDLRPAMVLMFLAAGIAIALPAAGLYALLVRAGGGGGADAS